MMLACGTGGFWMQMQADQARLRLQTQGAAVVGDWIYGGPPPIQPDLDGDKKLNLLEVMLLPATGGLSVAQRGFYTEPGWHVLLEAGGTWQLGLPPSEAWQGTWEVVEVEPAALRSIEIRNDQQVYEIVKLNQPVIVVRGVTREGYAYSLRLTPIAADQLYWIGSFPDGNGIYSGVKLVRAPARSIEDKPKP